MEVLLIIVAAIAIAVIWYVLGDFSCSIEGDELHIKWKILRAFQIGSSRYIEIKNIKEIRPYASGDFLGAAIFCRPQSFLDNASLCV